MSCQKKEVNYVDEGIQTQSDASQVDMSTSKLKDKLGVEEEWIEYIDKDKAIVISAEVNIPDVSSVKVIEASHNIYTEEEKKLLMKCLTNESIYKYPVSYEEMTKEQLKEHILYHEYHVEFLKYNQELANIYQAELDYLYELYSVAPDEYSVATDFSEGNFIIKYDNKDYVVRFLESDGSEEYTSRGDVSIYIENYADVYAENPNSNGVIYTNIVPQIEDVYYLADNRCDISQDKAKELALDFIENIKLGKFEIIDTYPLSLKGTNENYEHETWYDGYTFVMYRNIDGICIDGVDWSEVSTHPGNDIDYTSGIMNYPQYGYDKIFVCVNDDGIVQFDYSSPLRLGHVISDDVKILSYEKIQNAIRTEIINQSCYEYNSFKDLELVYFPIQDESDLGKYTIVPIWILKSYDTNKIKSYVAVNAIDGSIIYINDQMYDEY